MIPYPIPYEHCENELLIALSLGALINSSSSDLWISACQTVLHGQPALECTGSWLKYRLYFRPKVSKNWAGGDWVFVSVTIWVVGCILGSGHWIHNEEVASLGTSLME